MGCIIFEVATVERFIQCPMSANSRQQALMLLKAIIGRLGPPPDGLLPGSLAFEAPAQVFVNQSLKRLLEQSPRHKNILKLSQLCLHWDPQDRASAVQLLSACQETINTQKATTPSCHASLMHGSSQVDSTILLPSSETRESQTTPTLQTATAKTGENLHPETQQREEKAESLCLATPCEDTPSLLVSTEMTDLTASAAKALSARATTTKRPRWNHRLNQTSNTSHISVEVPAQTEPTPPGLSGTSTSPYSECTCRSVNCRRGSHARGQKCQAQALPGFAYCDICKCQEPACNKSQLGVSKYCYGHAFSALSPNLKLIQLMGLHGFIEEMEPADLMRLRELKTTLF